MENYKLRTEPNINDLSAVRNILQSSGFFRPDEVDVAVELVQERLEKGAESGYEFIFMDIDDRTVAYVCYGLIPCSLISYDLYWIGTHQDYRNKGLGKIILKETEESVRKLNGKAIYIETSSKEMYLPTQKFYVNNNYELKFIYEDFYDIGDSKFVYVKRF